MILDEKLALKKMNEKDRKVHNLEQQVETLQNQLFEVTEYIKKFGPLWEKQLRELGRQLGQEMQEG